MNNNEMKNNAPVNEEVLGEMIEDTIDGMYEAVVEKRTYSWSNRKLTIRAALDMWKRGDLLIPKCQRLYVWTSAQQRDLINTLLQNLPFGDITVGQVDGKNYLGDGYQRLTTAMLSLEDPTVSDEDKRIIRNYTFNMVTIQDMNWSEFNAYFRLRNNGTKLASVVKERARLHDDLVQAVLDISSHPYFRSKKFKATFVTNQQPEIIAMTALLASAGIRTNTKAKSLADSLQGARKLALENKDKAKEAVEFIIGAFQTIPDALTKKAFTANYVNALIYVVLEHPEYTYDDIYDLTERIFGASRADYDYRTTVGGGATSLNSLERRIAILDKKIQEIIYERVMKEQESELEASTTDTKVAHDTIDGEFEDMIEEPCSGSEEVCVDGSDYEIDEKEETCPEEAA